MAGGFSASTPEPVSGLRHLEALEREARRVRWGQGTREERYTVFARSFSRRSSEADCLDLEDLEAVVSGDGAHG